MSAYFSIFLSFSEKKGTEASLLSGFYVYVFLILGVFHENAIFFSFSFILKASLIASTLYFTSCLKNHGGKKKKSKWNNDNERVKNWFQILLWGDKDDWETIYFSKA